MSIRIEILVFFLGIFATGKALVTADHEDANTGSEGGERNVDPHDLPIWSTGMKDQRPKEMSATKVANVKV
jgi:hypothetical protein